MADSAYGSSPGGSSRAERGGQRNSDRGPQPQSPAAASVGFDPSAAAFFLDGTISQPSTIENAEGHYLILADLRWYWDQYVTADVPRTEPELSPLHAGDLTGLAPALVLTAGFDPLRDEGDLYGQRLATAGVPVRRLSFPGQIHGFVRGTALFPEAHDALAEIGAFVRGM